MEADSSLGGFIITTFLWSALIGLLGFHLFKKWLLFKRMPPGPYGLPFIGSIGHLSKVNTIEEFQKYKKKYGNIFSFACGDHYVIVINGYKTIQEVSKRDEFCGRPDFHVWYLRNYGIKNRGILFNDVGPVWQEQRRFALRSLRDFGFGKESMEGMIYDELEHLVVQLKKDLGTPVNLTGAFNASVLNSLWMILTGKRFELDDPQLLEVIQLLTESLRKMVLTSVGLFFPLPAKYNLVRRGAWAQGTAFRLKVRAIIEKIVKEHLSSYNESVTRDFTDSYIHEMKKSENGSSFYESEGELNLKVTLVDLFVAGAETSSTTLLWSILYLTQNLDAQRKVQAEIDAIIGSRPATRDDKPKMVYLEAFLSEVHRMCSLLPMSVYHKMIDDVEFQGYIFPKGSAVFLNLHDAHHDSEVWGETANEFRPERFLDTSGTKFEKHEALMSFGVGKRQCLGELLARDTLFIFLTGLLQQFNFEIDESDGKVDVNGTPTFISSPNPFKVIISERRR